MMPIGLYIYLFDTIHFTFDLMPWYRAAMNIWGVSQVTLLCFFNIYWMTKIIKGTLKMLGCIKSKKKKQLTDELIQTDSEMMVPMSLETDLL